MLSIWQFLSLFFLLIQRFIQHFGYIRVSAGLPVVASLNFNEVFFVLRKGNDIITGKLKTRYKNIWDDTKGKSYTWIILILYSLVLRGQDLNQSKYNST